MTCTKFNTGSAVVGATKQVGNVTYQYQGNGIWTAITAPLSVKQLTDSGNYVQSVTLEAASLAEDQLGTRYSLSDYGYATYEYVESQEGGGFFVSHGSKTFKLISLLFESSESAGIGYGGDKTTTTSEINDYLDSLSAGSVVDMAYRISLPTTTSYSEVANFSDIRFKDNVTVKYQAATREQVKYLNHISDPYGTFLSGVPVNEDVVAAPYHVARILDLKTPASFSEPQTAHEIADEYSLVGKNYMSNVWRVDGKTFLQDLVDTTSGAEYRKLNLTPRSGTYVDLLLVNREVMNLTNGNIGVQMPTAEYPHDVAGARRVVRSSSNQYDNNQRYDRVQDVMQDLVVGRGYRDYINPANGIKVFAEFPTASAEGTAVRQYAPSQTYMYVCSGYGVSSAASAWKVGYNSTTNRSISCGGTVNVSGADYAEYMKKSGDFILAKGEVCGINKDGELTNVFDDAIKFCIKSTDPSFVGGDKFDYDNERIKYDRIAFCGQVPILGDVKVGEYAVPFREDSGSIGVRSVHSPSMSEYLVSVGQCIKIDGNPIVVVRM